MEISAQLLTTLGTLFTARVKAVTLLLNYQPPDSQIASLLCTWAKTNAPAKNLFDEHGLMIFNLALASQLATKEKVSNLKKDDNKALVANDLQHGEK